MSVPARHFPLQQFPNLEAAGYEETSIATKLYNCIAWAAEDKINNWWPAKGAKWPKDAPKEINIAAFVAAFETLAYERCDNGDLEEGYKKIALYALNDVPKHAARQLPDGRWTSKMGKDIDIVHPNVGAVEGPFYGRVVAYMRKPL
jgi:hypothetical protein